MCAWARASSAPRHSSLGCSGVRLCVRAPLLPRHFWLGCASWGCVLGLGFRLRPAPPGWGVGVRVCSRVRASLVPRHSWLGCTVGVCVCKLAFQLRPATPGCGVRVRVRLRARSSGTPPLLAGVCGVGVCAWARGSAGPRPSWLGCWGVCVCVLAPLVPCHSWLGRVVSVCVLRLGFRLHPATPGWGVGVCVCSCAHSAGAPATPGWGARCGCVCLGSGFGCALPA